MFLDSYEHITINDFRGQYDRVAADDCPLDHAQICQNFISNRKQFQVRDGTKLSLNTGHNVVRQFLTTANTVLTCDGVGNIYSTTVSGGAPVTTLFLTVTNMIDFVAINLYGHVFILPICTAAAAGTVLYVWDTINPPRPALGNPPGSGPTVAQAAGGNIVVGTHKFAVVFVTTTGFSTAPGPSTSFTFTAGNGTANLTVIPTGPTGTTQRLILATKANLNTFYFVPSAAGGVINDNVTTTATLNFFDTDLAIDASPQFNFRGSITAAITGYGGAGLAVYKGRLIILDGTVANQVPVSQSGLPENFDTVVGFIQTDYQVDQFISAFEYFGTLYISGNVGIHATGDNGGDPSTWSVNLIESGNGFPHYSLISVLENKYRGPISSLMFGTTREGVYVWNGALVRPALTWKIQGTWNQFTHGSEHAPMSCVDITTDTLYIMIPSNGSTTPNLLIAGNFSNGLDFQNIEWSVFVLPYTPQCIMICSINDNDDFDYWLRIGKSSGVDKLTSKVINDSGTVITAKWQTTNLPQDGSGDGSLRIFRFMRVRSSGSGALSLTAQDEDNGNVTTIPAITLAAAPSQDYGKHLNYTNEKVSFTLTNTSGNCILKRLDFWHKRRWQSRPL